MKDAVRGNELLTFTLLWGIVEKNSSNWKELNIFCTSYLEILSALPQGMERPHALIILSSTPESRSFVRSRSSVNIEKWRWALGENCEIAGLAGQKG